MTTRCKNGSRRCFSGKCFKPQSVTGSKRCKNGSRKCANRKCYKTKKNVVLKKYTLRNRVVNP